MVDFFDSRDHRVEPSCVYGAWIKQKEKAPILFHFVYGYLSLPDVFELLYNRDQKIL